jgi:choline dehydrogenase
MRLKRRDLLRSWLLLGTVWPWRKASAAATGPAAAQPPSRPVPTPPASMIQPSGASVPNDADFIVVGSGAGGGTVAARLAEEGYTVLLLEAGGDPRTSNADDYDVPAFHPRATENEAMKWSFFVRHYRNDEQQRRDPKYRATDQGQAVDGVLYPRAATLGGCTAHNAMILVYPHDSDWNELADLTGDSSWRADRMRTYFERIENCGHRPFEKWRSKIGLNPSRHGWSGWLHTEHAIPRSAFKDRNLRRTLLDSIHTAFGELGPANEKARIQSHADPNDARSVAENAVGLRYLPVTTRNHQRVGTRERLLDVAARHPDRLNIRTHALVTRVLFDDRNRAIGVEYLEGERLYHAASRPTPSAGEPRRVLAAREVILAGGAFNTPQLLMLSGIGPRGTLDARGIPVRIDLPGVGQNLQDRYEVAVVNRMAFPAWDALDGASLSNTDRQYREWAAHRTGVYITNGAMLSVALRSSLAAPVPDLLCYAVLADFTGYYPGYSDQVAGNNNVLTWVILKAHTNNTAGEVTLRSADPRDPPLVNFKYFEEGSDASGEDLRAVVEGVKFVRRLSAGLKTQSLVAREELPGDQVSSDEQLRQFVRDNAWGHHASCTCRIGAQRDGGVLTSDFKVHGTERLRIVDASVFPRVPGFFIASAIYMIGEKAADVILKDVRAGRRS